MSACSTKLPVENNYDETNIFAKILRGEIPFQKIYENEYALAFHDVYPKAPIHALVIPKGPYKNVYEFYTSASPEEILGLSKVISKVIDLLSLENSGFRMITNCGEFGRQEIPHLHFHIVSGHPLGEMLHKKT